MSVSTQYNSLLFKFPKEAEHYREVSDYVVKAVENIIEHAINSGNNKIILNTNLKLGIPMENINKIAGPFLEAWAQEIFSDIVADSGNNYKLINVEVGERLNLADIILQFQMPSKYKGISAVTGKIDVKATSNDIVNAGKSPNITSFARIRTAYIEDPDMIFIILSLKHKVYSKRDSTTKMMMGVMEVVGHNAYDLKYLSSRDISYNPALGSGQIQVRDIHYVNLEIRNVWEFCQILDKKCIASKKGFTGWLAYAKQYEWIKNVKN